MTYKEYIRDTSNFMYKSWSNATDYDEIIPFVIDMYLQWVDESRKGCKNADISIK